MEELEEYLEENGFRRSAWEGYWIHDNISQDCLKNDNGKLFYFSGEFNSTISEIKTKRDIDVFLKEFYEWKITQPYD